MKSYRLWLYKRGFLCMSILFLLLPAAILAGSAGGQETKQNWQLEWEKTLEAAKREGRVVVYGSATFESTLHEFEKRYPEIKVLHVIGQGAATQQRVLSERRAGMYLVDVGIHGGTIHMDFLRANALDSLKAALILLEVVDESSRRTE